MSKTLEATKAGERTQEISRKSGKKLVVNQNGRKVFVSSLDPSFSLETHERGGYGALRFFKHGRDHKGNNQGADLQIRRVGTKNPEAEIQITISQDTFFEATNRTRKEYISFSIPADMVQDFLKAATEIES